ncbi:MAG TPA: AAA family ATPase [Chloroflexia bacterium]|nr:AAA family ATPase [Chloroflexia bacterium]
MTLHLMVGLPCSGKTTLARQLEREYSALRLTLDAWHVRLYGQDAADDEHDARHELIEAIQWDVAARALVLGVDVILDFGCWVRIERDAYRRRAEQLGVEFRIHYLETPQHVLRSRLVARNAHLPPDTFYIPDTKLEEWFHIFEPPFSEELPYTLIYRVDEQR